MLQQVSTLESASFGFDDGAGVMGDQPAQHGVGMLCVAQVPGAIELVQAREGKARGRSRCRAAMRRLPADGRPRRERVPGRVHRAATLRECAQRRERGSCRSARASCSAQEASVFMWPRLGSCGGPFTDVACHCAYGAGASGARSHKGA